MTVSTHQAIKHFARHRPSLVNFAKFLGASHDEAQDCVQDTLTKAWQHIDQFHGDNYDMELRTWLIAILRNRFYDRCRRAKTRAKYHHLASPDPVCRCRGEESSEVERIIRAIDGLNEAQRVVITSYLLGGEYHEIAEQLGVPIGTIKSRLARAREALACEVA